MNFWYPGPLSHEVDETPRTYLLAGMAFLIFRIGKNLCTLNVIRSSRGIEKIQSGLNSKKIHNKEASGLIWVCFDEEEPGYAPFLEGIETNEDIFEKWVYTEMEVKTDWVNALEYHSTQLTYHLSIVTMATHNR